MKFKLLTLGILLASVVAVSSPVAAQQECKVDPAVQGLSLTDLTNKSTTIKGNTITTRVVVTGDEDCKKSVSVATWKFPNQFGLPLKDQVLYKTSTKTFGPGEHTISVEVPDCYWQADIMEGTRPTAADGSADYRIGDPSDPKSDRFLDVAYGGSKECFPKTTPAPETPTSTPVVSVLPSTGSGSAVVVVMTAAVSALAYAVIRKFKTQQ